MTHEAGRGDAAPRKREIVVHEDPVTGVWRFELEDHKIEVEPRRGYVKIDGVLHRDRRLEGLVDVSELEGRPLSAIDELLSSPAPPSRLRTRIQEDSPILLSRSALEAPGTQETRPSPHVEARVSKTAPQAETSDLSEHEAVSASSDIEESAEDPPRSGRRGDKPDPPSETPRSEGEERRSAQDGTSETESTYLTTPQAAGYLQLKPNTLERWRSDGGGPVFVKVGGRVFYRREDLDDFIESRRRKSTADPGSESPA